MSSDELETPQSEADQERQDLSQEKLRELADRVYQLLKEEARIEYERYRPANNHRPFGQGGR